MKKLLIILSIAVMGCTKELPRYEAIKNMYIPAPDTVALYILAGQSNCGRPQYPGNGSTGPVATDSERLIYDSAITGFQIYNPGYDSNAFHNVQAGVNTMLINFLLPTEMGPEVSFMKCLKDSGTAKEAYIIKYGFGNTDLAYWWLDTGKVYLNKAISKALRLLILQNKIPVLKGFIWMQGENDATDSLWATHYQYNLNIFFSQFDQYYGDEMLSLGFSFPAYTKVIGRINGIDDPTEIYRNLVRYYEENYCDTYPNSYWINTDNYPLFGGVHYTLAGQIQFGKDIYQILK